MRLRYNLAYLTLLLQGLAFGLTAWWTYPVEVLPGELQGGPPLLVVEEITTVLTTSSLADGVLISLEPYLPFVLTFWLIGLCFFLLRLGFGVWQWQRLRTVGLSVVPAAWRELLAERCRQLGVGRQVEIAFSTKVSGPMILGQVKPLILLPIGLANQLSLAEVELVLTHELAHLKRYDFIFNFIQSVLEAVLYYHPAVWWTGNQIRTLREACCDEWVTTSPGRSLQYARTLLTLAERTQYNDTLFQLAFLGNRRGALYQRIQYILNQPTKQSDMREKFAVTALLVLLAIGVSLHATSAEANLSTVPTPFEGEMTVDTLPDGNIRFNLSEDGETFDVELADRKIKRLSINGEEIPEARFPEYEAVVEEKMKDFPAPPLPPPPPSPGLHGLPAPPPRPAPPAPDGGQHYIIEIEEHQTISLDGEELDIDNLSDIDTDDIATVDVRKGEGGIKTITIITKDGSTQVMKIRESDGPVVIRTPDGERERVIIRERHRARANQARARAEGVRARAEQRQKMRYQQSYHADSIAKQAREIARIERDLERQRKGEIELAEEEVQRMKEEQEALEKSLEELTQEMTEELEIAFDERKLSEMEALQTQEELDLDIEMPVIITNSDSDWLKSYLTDEGYISDPTNYTLKLDNKRIKVDGKRLPEAVHQRVLELYEAVHGEPLRGSITKSERRN
ncbi:MAG: hypothetical protein D6772_14500 [Bacteroidetes bacterium]|nr:MAG: hypothetical protein D6772_14500 [Bacteroidota bacterium]